MAINRQIVLHLLNRLKDFNEWGQALVLETITKYVPEGENELYDVLVRVALG